MFQSLSYGECEGYELYVACLGSLAIYGGSMLLVYQSCNIRSFYVACLESLATYKRSMLLV